MRSLEALLAELKVLQLWDRWEDEIARLNDTVEAGFVARRMRRREIICEIETLSRERAEQCKFQPTTNQPNKAVWRPTRLHKM